MIETPGSPALQDWRNVAFTPGHTVGEPEKLIVYTDGDYTHSECILISRESAEGILGPTEETIDLLVISLSKRNYHTDERVPPEDASLLKHITNLLGEAYAAASIAQPSMSTDGMSTYRMIFVGADQRPILAVEVQE